MIILTFQSKQAIHYEIYSHFNFNKLFQFTVGIICEKAA